MDQGATALREGLKEVFGCDFQGFSRILSTASSSGAIRYGVAVPSSPMAPRQPPLDASYQSNSNSLPRHSTEELIQKMTTELVPNNFLPPLERSLPAFNNKDYLTAPPSSSSRSTPEQTDCKRGAKRKTKTDSDSEVEHRERDRRKRPKDLPVISKPGTSNDEKVSGARRNNQMRELFGDDEKDCLKAITPDSGVHSTENEILDDICNTQSILNMFTRISSPLSPLHEGATAKSVKDRLEKERKEKREKEEAEKQRVEKEQMEKDKERERERARKEQDEKERRRKEQEKREKKEAERKEAERRAEEERVRKAAEEEKERARLAAEEEERSRRAAEVEMSRITAEEERKRAEEIAEKERRQKAREYERKREETRRKAEEERVLQMMDKNKEMERASTSTPEPYGLFNLDRLRGELSLKTLSPNKIKQLEEMGRMNGCITANKVTSEGHVRSLSSSTKDIVKKETKLKDPKKESKSDSTEKKKSDKDRDRASEKTDKQRRSEKKDKASVLKAEETSGSRTNSPRPSSAAAQTPPSSSSGREFRCACNECMPTKPVREERPPADANPESFYQDIARKKKRAADSESDYLLRMLMYCESVIYFAMYACSLKSSTEKDKTNLYNIIKDSCEMLKCATQRFVTKDVMTPLMQHHATRARGLSLRIQSVLGYHMFFYKSSVIWKTHQLLESYSDFKPVRVPTSDRSNEDDACGSGTGAVQPSPASSVHSSSNGGSTRMIAVPEEVYINQKHQLKYATHLMFAQRLWGDAIVTAQKSSIDTMFFNSVESVCGHLCVNTQIDKLTIFVLTSINWLRREYEIEKQRPSPQGESKRFSTGSSGSSGSSRV